MRTPARPRFGRVCGRIALAGCVAVAPSLPARAQVLPSGGTVAAGSASIIAIDPAKTVIVQQSSKAVVNWQSFSVGAGANVTFQQPDAAAITLNRVTGAGASIIDGSLLANGQVWLVNGNGILMGQGSRIDVGGLLATTSDIADQDFLSGRYDFGKTSSNAAVINRGSIKAATGGSAILSGAHVANEGLIQAKLGRVVLGGAKAFSVSFDGDNLIQYQITAPVSETPRDGDGKPASTLVSNSGTIDAQGGQVLMTARAARNVVDNVINSTGLIQARSASVRNGEVVLDAGEDGAVAVAGMVDVSGGQAGEGGGALTVLGAKIAVADGTRLDASGNSGGGQILIGGNLQAAGPLPNAQSVAVGKAVITANATGSGKGGTVAIISSGQTSVAATISAKGVAAGGLVETSGHDLRIAESTRVDTSANSGATGLWLLDPIEVDIDAAAAANIVTSIASTNVSVTATNDITVNAPITYSSPNSLVFLAGHRLTFNESVQNGGSGDIMAVSGWDGTTPASAILTTPNSYGNDAEGVLINGAFSSGGVSLGSRNGATIVASHDLTLLGTAHYAQLGYYGARFASVSAQGSIDAILTGRVLLAGGDNPDAFAQIGHGGPQTSGAMSGAITIKAQGPVSLAGGSSVFGYARIGHGGLGQGGGSIDGNVVVASGASISLGKGSSVNAGGTGDSIVLAAAGDFSNQAGSAAFEVSPGGRWLVFLNSPANNIPGGGTPFYNRAFDFSANSYAPVASAGNRFVYAIAPVVTVTANNAAKVYGAANPAFSATISGGLAGDAPAGVFGGSPSLTTSATLGSAVGNYAITASLGTLVSDYNYGFQFVTGVLQINPAILTASLTGTVRKTYDGTTTASVSASNYTLAGLLAGDSVTVNSAAAFYGDRNVGTGLTVTASGLTLSGPAGGNYVLASPVASAAIGIIDPAVLSAVLSGTVRKTYDGTTLASLSASNYALAGVIAGDNVTLNNPSIGSYGDKNAGTGKIVTVSGLTLSGAHMGNYVLASPVTSAAIGMIDPASVTASLSGTVRKTYDGSTAASLSASHYNLAGLLAGDSVTVSAAAAVYGDKNAGTGKTVTASGLTLSGPAGGNYVLASPVTSAAIGIIDSATLSAVLTGTVRKTYDGTTTASPGASNYNLAGLVAGDSVSVSAAAAVYGDKNAGAGKTVAVSGLTLSGADMGNYVLASPVTSAAVGMIDPASVTASLTGTVRKTYDGSTAASLSASNYTLMGILPGDSVALNNPSAGAFGDKNAGTGKTVTVSGLTLSGAAGGNYVLASPVISAAIGMIDPASVTAFLVGTVQKPFDGTTAAALNSSNYNLSAVISGDNVSLSNPVAGTYDSADVGAGRTITVTGLTLLGADGGNYILASATISAVIGTITVAPIGLLGNSFTTNGVSPGFLGQFSPPAGGNAPAQGPSDATSDTGANGDSAQSDGAAFSLGQSLSGNAQSSSAVLLDGLLRQVTPSPGGSTRGVPPYGQIFSSWGNEAFWQ